MVWLHQPPEEQFVLFYDRAIPHEAFYMSVIKKSTHLNSTRLIVFQNNKYIQQRFCQYAHGIYKIVKY